MSNRTWKSRLVLGMVLLAMAAGAPLYHLTHAADPAPAAQPAKRDAQAVQQDLQATGQELQKLISSPKALFDPEERAKIAPKAIPIMRKMVGLFDELGQVEPAAKEFIGGVRLQMLSLLSLMGEEQADAELKKAAESTDPAEALSGKSTSLLVQWWKNKDADAQAKVADQVEALAKANPNDDRLASIIMVMSQQGAATPALQTRMEDILVKEMKSEVAKQVAQQLEATRKLREIEGKPLVLKGKTIEGKDFSSEDLKGKVVLVDFWATWCGPCMAELPRVKKVYADFKDKGLEIVGVSCDNNAQALKDFRTKNPDAPWTQLFDEAKPGWHALAKEYGIQGIPTMFLIDKKGVVRSVTARENFEEMIPKLLAE